MGKMRYLFQIAFVLTFVSIVLETYAAVALDHKKNNHEENNEISKTKVEYKPVQAPNSQRKTYNQTMLTSVPDCYSIQEETTIETIERYMCVVEDMIYSLRISDPDMDPAWLYWNDRNPMKTEKVHCHNIAMLYEKKLQCYQFALYFDVFENAVESIVETIELDELLDMPIDDIFYMIEDQTAMSTEGLREEIIDLIFETILEYLLDAAYDTDTGDMTQVNAEDDGPASYYYYYYYDQES